MIELCHIVCIAPLKYNDSSDNSDDNGDVDNNNNDDDDDDSCSHNVC
jgi:hypothetical protein